MGVRTTLTLDDRVAAQLKRIAHESARPFKVVVNETLRAGLQARASPGGARPYRIKPARLGEPRPGYDLTRALALADALEDEEIARELAARK
jgi:hypothetical protein